MCRIYGKAAYAVQLLGRIWIKGACLLKIEIDRQEKIVEIWLSNQEQQDVEAMKNLAEYYWKYQAEKYKVAVFLSGKGELTGLTEELLLHNRRIVAKAELVREKPQQSGMTMSM